MSEAWCKVRENVINHVFTSPTPLRFGDCVRRWSVVGSRWSVVGGR
ncbi:MAG: hypothetical protein ABIG63_09760 [Chloroflexota bacterium]